MAGWHIRHLHRMDCRIRIGGGVGVVEIDRYYRVGKKMTGRVGEMIMIAAEAELQVKLFVLEVSLSFYVK